MQPPLRHERRAGGGRLDAVGVGRGASVCEARRRCRGRGLQAGRGNL